LTDNSLQSTDKDQQESHAVAEKPHDAVVKFDMYQNLQRHRAVLPTIAWHLVIFVMSSNFANSWLKLSLILVHASIDP